MQMPAKINAPYWLAIWVIFSWGAVSSKIAARIIDRAIIMADLLSAFSRSLSNGVGSDIKISPIEYSIERKRNIPGERITVLFSACESIMSDAIKTIIPKIAAIVFFNLRFEIIRSR